MIFRRPTKKFENGLNGETIKTFKNIIADFTDSNSNVTTSGNFDGTHITGNSVVNAGGDINVLSINQAIISSQGDTKLSSAIASNISTGKDAWIKTAIKTVIQAKGNVIIEDSLIGSNAISQGIDISDRLINSTVAAKKVKINECKVKNATIICETIDAEDSLATNTIIAQHLCDGAFKISKIGNDETPLDFASLAGQPCVRIDLHDPESTITTVKEITEKGWDISPETLRTMAKSVATSNTDISVEQSCVHRIIDAYEDFRNEANKFKSGVLANPNLGKAGDSINEMIDIFNKENGTSFVVFELEKDRTR